MNRPLALVLGANGRFGAAAVQALAAEGYAVLAQARRAPAAPLPAHARLLQHPLHDTAALARDAAGARIVVYAVNPPYTRWAAELQPLAEQGMAVAERLGARFMLPGNVYNYGPQMPPLLRPDTPQPGGTEKGRQRCLLESTLRERAAAGRLQATIVRAGDFYGAGRGNWFDLVIARDIVRGRLVYPGPLDVPHAWAFLPDLAQVFALLARRPGAPDFESLHFEGHTLTGAALLQGIEDAAGAMGLQPRRGWRRGAMPWGLVRAGGLVVPMWRELARMRYLWTRPHALDGSLLAATLQHWQPTPLAVALARALAELHPAPSKAAAWA